MNLDAGLTGLGLLLAFCVFVIFCLTKPSQKITLRDFCHELWLHEPMARWKWWVLLMLLIWKL